METEDMILKELLKIAVNMKLPESELLHVADEYNISTLQYANICQLISVQGYDIVSDDEYQSIVDSLKSTEVIETPDEGEKVSLKQHTKYDNVISEFNKLQLSDKYRCLIKLAAIIAAEDEKAKISMAESFMQKVKNMNLQYSYIAVLLKAFFIECDDMGKVKLEKLINYFNIYYQDRQKNGLISEQSDSALGKTGFSLGDIKRIILFNPLKRSFLAEYFTYHKEADNVYINETLWTALSNTDKEDILKICDEKLSVYYNKISA